jgi:hypothetical protein
MPSITSWTRLEPRTRDPLLPGLAARVHDPLWLLARQWQFGELTGEDAGSPVRVRLAYEQTVTTRYRAGSGAAVPLPPGVPLEATVEAEAPPPPDARLAAEAGQVFLRLLGPALAGRYGAGYRRVYPLAPPTAADIDACDDASVRALRLLAGRAVDGAALRTALSRALRRRRPGPLPADPPVDAADEPAVRDAALAWLAWWDRRQPPPPADQAWQPERLSHGFALGAPTTAGEVVLGADGYRGGRLDWYAVDVLPAASLGAAADPGATTPPALSTLPARLGFPGMPAPRFWEFENADVDFGAVEAAPDDLGRLLLTEFALVYGNDFFCVPLAVPTGSLTRVTTLEVTTTFGETVTVPTAAAADRAAGRDRWRMFHLSAGRPDAGAGEGWLFVPPAALDVQDGTAVEDVLLARDETANLAWAIERSVTGPAGTVVDRHAAYQARRARADAAAGGGAAPTGVADPPARYRLATELPPFWLALLPVRAAAGSARVRLELRALEPPLGRLMAPAVPIDEAEVPRAGTALTRRHRRARWLDGSTHLWTGRTARPGRGESTSGLRFDDIEPA